MRTEGKKGEMREKKNRETTVECVTDKQKGNKR